MSGSLTIVEIFILLIDAGFFVHVLTFCVIFPEFYLSAGHVTHYQGHKKNLYISSLYHVHFKDQQFL